MSFPNGEGLEPTSFTQAVRRFREINSEDPRTLDHMGEPTPHALVESFWLDHFISRLDARPSWALRLCAHCQHLRRFAYPRSEFPEGRDGYLAWRRAAAKRSFVEAAGILRSVGAAEATIECVEAIMTKQGRRQNHDVQIMEDALCLAFFRLEAVAFAQKHPIDDVIRILKRTWLKMSPRAHALSLTEAYPAPLDALLRDLASEPEKAGEPLS